VVPAQEKANLKVWLVGRLDMNEQQRLVVKFQPYLHVDRANYVLHPSDYTPELINHYCKYADDIRNLDQGYIIDGIYGEDGTIYIEMSYPGEVRSSDVIHEVIKLMLDTDDDGVGITYREENHSIRVTNYEIVDGVPDNLQRYVVET
jgi:hypothetical protein